MGEQYRSAEAWLAERGVERRDLFGSVLQPADEPGPQPSSPPGAPGPPLAGTPAETPGEAVDAGDLDAALAAAARPLVPASEPVDEQPPPRLKELARLATEPPPQPLPPSKVVGASLSDEVTRLVAYARRATTAAPMSEGRLRDRLRSRCDVDTAVDAAMERCRRERLVDDRAMATALVEEWRAKGHADRRVADDLRKRGFDGQLITELVTATSSSDPQAEAFAAAQIRIPHLRNVTPETAHRRLVAYLARRGYNEGLARKVARDALWADREAQRAAEH